MVFLLLTLAIFAMVTIFLVANTAGFFFGAPFAPTPQSIIEAVFDKLSPGKKDIVYDLGFGDGRVLLTAAKRGISTVGYEINPILYLLTLLRIYLHYRDNRIKLHFGSFWKGSFEDGSIIFAFILPQYMDRLEKKLAKEVKKGTYVVTYLAQLTGRKPVSFEDGAYIYKF